MDSHKKVRILTLYIIFALTCFSWSGIKVLASDQRVIADPGYLTSGQVQELESELEEVYQDHEIELVIVITEDMEGKSSMDYADDYFDYNNYGYPDTGDGILFLINMEDREWWFSTSGTLIDKYQSNIDYMGDQIVSDLKAGNYDEAGMAFIESVRDIENGKVVDGKLIFVYRILKMMMNPILLGLSLIIGGGSTWVLSLKEKERMMVNGFTYEGGNGLVEKIKTDHLLDEHTTRTRIPRNTGGSGGGGMGGGGIHTGSSGRSHGGGGGSF